MKILLSHPGVGEFIQQTGLALLEANMLDAFATTYNYNENTFFNKLLRKLPSVYVKNIHYELSKRTISELPRSKIRSYPYYELIRSLISKYDKNGKLSDYFFEKTSKNIYFPLRTHD